MEKIKIHCLTNPVTMQDVANILLAAGGSPIMGQDPEEAEEIARLCQAVLLNTGVPDERKFQACILAGKTANMLGHPVVLDPVGAGASVFREKGLRKLLQEVHPRLWLYCPGKWKNGRGFRRCPYSGAYRRQWEGFENHRHRLYAFGTLRTVQCKGKVVF